VEKIITSPVKRSPKFELKHSIFYFDENGKLNLSNEALRYMVEIQSMVALQDKSGKKFTREEWKESLSILVDIQEA
jgi:Ca2+-binding EF-hand superfamily protein